jgi:hypothetical protein
LLRTLTVTLKELIAFGDSHAGHLLPEVRKMPILWVIVGKP